MSKSSAITQRSLNAVKTVRIEGSVRFITGTNTAAAEGPTVGPDRTGPTWNGEFVCTVNT